MIFKRHPARSARTAPTKVTRPTYTDDDRETTLRLVAEWRFPDDSAAQRGFRRRHRGPLDLKDPRTWILTGHHGYENQGALVLTFDEAERLDLVRCAKRLEKAALREAKKAPLLPENPENIDSVESVEWAASHVYAPRVLKLAEGALSKIAAGQWDAARPLILKAELEVNEVDDQFKMLERRRLVAENQRLANLKKRLRDNAARATEAKSEQAAERRAAVRKTATVTRTRNPGLTNYEIARLLHATSFQNVSVRTLRRILGGQRTFGGPSQQ